jgi:nitrite reductase (NADH) large subunit
MVSHSLCEAMTERGAPRPYQITVLGDEPYPAYDRVHLSSGAGASPALLASREWYADRGMTLRTSAAVSAIDRAARTVHLQDGEQLAYDVLVLATGAAPRLPACPGLDAPGVFAYRNFDDVVAIRAAAAGARRAAVVGGGLLGLEAAQLLRDAGVGVTLIEASRQLMPRQLDADSAVVLQERVRALGVELRLAAQLAEIEPEPGGLRLSFEGGESLEVDLVVVAIGVVPRDALAREAGLPVGVRGGMIVDDALCTSDPAIFAIGDCTCHRGRSYGLIGPGVQMARALAANLLGTPMSFEQADLSCELKLLGIPVSAVGDYDSQSDVVTSGTAELRVNLLMVSRHLIGATAVGHWPELARVRLLASRRERLPRAQLARFERTGRLFAEADAGVASWPEAAIVCNCRRVTRATLSVLAPECGGQLSQLCQRSGAGTVCGSCRPLVAELLGVAALPPPGQRSRLLLGLSLIAALCCGLWVAVPALSPADSVPGQWRVFDAFRTSDDFRKISGFTLAGVAVCSMLLSLRKRTRLLDRLAFGSARALHALLGGLSLAGLVAHTGLSVGSNLSFALLACFLGAALAGGLTGVATSLETTQSAGLARPARRARSPLTWFHQAWRWPQPVLLGAHVLAADNF